MGKILIQFILVKLVVICNCAVFVIQQSSEKLVYLGQTYARNVYSLLVYIDTLSSAYW